MGLVVSKPALVRGAHVLPRTTCPYCHSRFSIVKDIEGTRRRRQCLGCAKRYSTTERVEVTAEQPNGTQ